MTAQKRPAKRTMTEPGLGKVDANARGGSTSGDTLELSERSPESSPPVESRRLTRGGVPSVPVSENAPPSAPPVRSQPPVSQPPVSQPPVSQPPVSQPPARRAEAVPAPKAEQAARPVSSARDVRADAVRPPWPDRISTRRDLRVDEDAPRSTAPDSTRPVATASGAKPARRAPSAPPATTGPSGSSGGNAGMTARTVPLTREALEARAERDATDARDGSSAWSRRPTMRNPPEASPAALANAAAATARRPAFKVDKVESAPPPRTDTRRRTVSEERATNESPRAPRTTVRGDQVPIESAVKSGGPDSIRVAPRSIPRLLLTKAEIAVAPIDHRAGFLLAYLDGTTTVQGLVDIEVMPENEVHEILDRLRRLGIVAIR